MVGGSPRLRPNRSVVRRAARGAVAQQRCCAFSGSPVAVELRGAAAIARAGRAVPDHVRDRARHVAERVLLPAQDVVLHERALVGRDVRVFVGEHDRRDVGRDDRVVDELDAGRKRDGRLRGLAHVDREEHVLVRAGEQARFDVHVVHVAGRAAARVDVHLGRAVVALRRSASARSSTVRRPGSG